MEAMLRDVPISKSNPILISPSPISSKFSKTDFGIVAWPGAFDQPSIASQLFNLGVAIEIIQVRTGHTIGPKTALGVMVEGTEEAIPP